MIDREDICSIIVGYFGSEENKFCLSVTILFTVLFSSEIIFKILSDNASEIDNSFVACSVVL